MTAITSQEELNIMLTVVQTINSYLSDYVLVEPVHHDDVLAAERLSAFRLHKSVLAYELTVERVVATVDDVLLQHSYKLPCVR